MKYKLMTPIQTDKMFRLEQGCALEACEMKEITCTKTEDGWLIKESDARNKWGGKNRQALGPF